MDSGNGHVRNNHIYHNDLINNTDQARIYPASYTNYWDNGYPSGGNYWSDYAGVDSYSGPDQDVPGSDGKGDTPYVLDANNRDNYPLMTPWGAVPPAVITCSATDVTTNSATPNGDLTSMGTASSVDVSFEYGLTTSYGYETTPQTLTVTGPFSAPISGLDPNTTYHFKAKAVGHGTRYGDDMTFTTLAEVAAGSVSGAIYEQDGTTLVPGATISAYDYVQGTLVAEVVSSNGTYTLAGLPTGDYKVSASGTGYVDEYYQEETSLANANRVRVTANQEKPNIDFTLSQVYVVSPPPPPENAIVDDSYYSGAKVEFLNLTTSVEVYIILSDKNPGSDITGFQFLHKYYDIVTTPPYTGSVTLTISYNQADVKGKKKNLKLFHLVSGGWVRVTDPPPIIDENNNTITATVDSLSWFAIAEESAAPEGCFIATAAYGTSTASELDTLRAFRDEVLLQSSLGSQLVAFYYEISPPVADFISEHEPLRTLVRELLVDPVAWLVEATGTLWRD